MAALAGNRASDSSTHWQLLFASAEWDTFARALATKLPLAPAFAKGAATTVTGTAGSAGYLILSVLKDLIESVNCLNNTKLNGDLHPAVTEMNLLGMSLIMPSNSVILLSPSVITRV